MICSICLSIQGAPTNTPDLAFPCRTCSEGERGAVDYIGKYRRRLAVETEEVMRQGRKVIDGIAVPDKELRVFTAEKGTGAHCQMGYGRLMQVVFDWLDEMFATHSGLPTTTSLYA